MVRIIVPLAIIVIGAVIVFSVLRGKGLVRGMAGNWLVSPSRPAIAVVPAKDFVLCDAGRSSLSPKVQGSGLQSSSVSVIYGLFQHEEKTDPGCLLAALAIVDTDRMEWPTCPENGFSVFRQRSVTVDGEEGLAETFVLSSEDDPWRRLASWDGDSLVRRFTFLLWFRKAKLIVEYREPVPFSPLPLEDNLPLLAAFEERARNAFALRSGDALPRPEKQLPYPTKTLDRRDLTRYIGDLWDNVAR